MMKYTVIFIFFLSAALCWSQDSVRLDKVVEHEEYYQDSTKYIKYRVLLSDTIISDTPYELRKWISYYNEPCEITFVCKSTIDGKLWGKSSVFLNTAKFSVSVEYLNGVRHGLWTTRFPERLDYQGYYLHGKMNGRWVYQAFDGSQAESIYDNGALISGENISDEIYIIFELKHFEPSKK